MMNVVKAISVYKSYVHNIILCRNCYVRIIYICTYVHTYLLQHYVNLCFILYQSQNVTPHSTIDQMKSPTPMTSGQKLEVSDLKSALKTTDQKPILTSSTQPGPPSNTTIPKPNPLTMSQAPSLTSSPLTTQGETTHPVSVAPVSTPVEKGAPSTKVVPNPQLKKGMLYIRMYYVCVYSV